MKFFLLALALFTIASEAKGESVVRRAAFRQGNFWTWTYQNLDKKTQKWNPYFVETYTLAAVQGTKLTFLMSSGPVGEPKVTHHKFMMDFADCERQLWQPYYDWTIEFYTKSLGDDWQLVGKRHFKLPFSEKFNCVEPIPEKTAYDRYQGENIFLSPRWSEGSWYFLEGDKVGIAAKKLFYPRKDYQFELTESCLKGADCQQK